MTAITSRVTFGAALALVAVLGLAACAPGDQNGTTGSPDPAPSGDANTPVSGGNLNVQISGDPQTLDTPAANSSTVIAVVAPSIFETLFAFDRDYVTQPMLVDDYEVSDDALVYTLNLRTDVTWHDGTPFTSADAVASLNRWLKITASGKQAAAQFDSVEADGDHTVVIALNSPRWGLTSELAFSGTEMYQAAVLETLPDVDTTGSPFSNDQVIGTGPYKLASWDNQQIVVERYDDYASRTEDWGGAAGAKHAYLDSITYQFISEPNTILANLEVGDLDYGTISNDAFADLQGSDMVRPVLASGANPNVLIPNRDPSSPFSNLVARDALNAALDKSAILAGVGGESGTVLPDGAFTFKEKTPLYVDTSEFWDSYDPAKAEALFAEAGITAASTAADPLRILTTTGLPGVSQMATIIQDQLTAYGITAEIEVLDFTGVVGKATASPTEWDLVMLAFNGNIATPTTANSLSVDWAKNITQELLDLKADYAAAKSEEEARAAVVAIQDYVWTDLTFLTLSHQKNAAGVAQKVQGYEGFGGNFHNSWFSQN